VLPRPAFGDRRTKVGIQTILVSGPSERLEDLIGHGLFLYQLNQRRENRSNVGYETDYDRPSRRILSCDGFRAVTACNDRNE
jgi:hypothetical protein